MPPRTPIRRLPVLVVACALLVAACGASATTDAGGRNPGANPSGTGTGSGDATALDFVVPAVDGTTVRGADYVGDALAIWFWAPW